MKRDRMIRRGALTVVVLAATVGYFGSVSCERWKHPDPPHGAFPPRVGKMALEEKGDKNPNCTRADPLHCWAYYVVPSGDDEMTRIHYYMQIFDSPDEANARLDAYARERVTERNDITWEDGGQKVGRLLLKNTVHRDGDSIFGFCSVSYVKDSWVITIFHGYECDPAREFLKDLTAVTD